MEASCVFRSIRFMSGHKRFHGFPVYVKVFVKNRKPGEAKHRHSQAYRWQKQMKLPGLQVAKRDETAGPTGGKIQPGLQVAKNVFTKSNAYTWQKHM